MLHRRPNAIAAPFLGLLLAASLSACAFHYPTDRVNTIGAGENNRTSTVDALGMRVLASGPGAGRLIGAFSNELDTPATVTKVEVAGGGSTVAAFKPITLPGHAAYNLATEVADPITLSGSFQPGEVLMGVEITFTRAGQPDTITVDVPVVKPCTEYTAVPTPSPAPPTGKADGAATSAAAAAPTTGAFSCTAASASQAAGE